MNSGNGSDSNTNGDLFASVNFSTKEGGDCVSDERMREISLRLKITVPPQDDSDIWSDVTEPTDKTKIWWPVDPTTGVRIGQPKTWDAATSTWKPLGEAPEVKLPERRFGNDTVAAASAQSKDVVISPAMPLDDFFFSLSPTTRVGSGGYQAASANMNDFGWQITAQSKSLVTIEFFNVPTGGLGFDWRAEEKPIA